MSPGSIYNIRAYATNSVGVAYSNQIATTTNAILSTITTAEVSSIGSVIASCGGTITSDGGATVTERGVCWNTTGNPTVADAKTNNGSGTGNFTSAITGLIPGTNYYVRAYSVNRIGTTYGNTMLFKTLAILPIVTTGILNPLSPTTASCSGNISYDGGAPVTARGVCWSTAANPTVSDSKTNEGSGSGDFVSSITGLAPEITYYARAYAVNSAGTSYGNTLQLKTSAVLPTITTTTPTLLTNETVSCGGNISSDGGAVVSARGVCWSTSHNPTTADSKSSEGVGICSFSILITNLTQGLTYYIRSYATNSKGTAYGNEVIVVASLTPIITTSDPLFIKTTFFQAGGNVVFDGASPIAMRGVCWSTNPTPTISNAHTNDGNGSGIFSSSPSGLTPNTLYYVRAYATNYFGTTYGNEISVVTSYGEVTDADGNVYQTIKIGNQIWTRENLKTTKYNDGMPIDNNIGTTVTGAYCWYNNDINNKDTYGALYNAYTIATNKLAPIGWHVATSEEWSILLSNTIGNERLKESGTKHWVAPNLGNNLTGFSAVPGGKREPNLGYLYMGTQAVWWTSTVSYFGHDALFLDSYNKVIQGSTINSMRASVRCIMGTVSLPVVSMNPYHYDVRPTSATVNFTVTELGGPTITTTGVCWSSTNYLPTIADNKTSVAKIASANYYL